MFRNKIVRADGTTEVLGIKQGSFHYHSQMETAGKIQVGNVISAFIEFSFYVNVNNGVIPVGEQIKYYQVTDVNSDFVETSTTSENLIGTFNVTSSKTNKNICTIVAYDNISRLNVDYSLRLKEIQNQFPMRIRDLLDEAANYVGLTSNVGHYSRVDILYTGMLPAFYSDGITVRDLFVWAGTLVGDAIYAGAQGTIYQRSYGAKYNGRPWKYSNRYIISPTDQEEYYTPDGTVQLTSVFYKQDSFYSDEYSIIPYDCVEVYKSDGSLFATYSPSGSTNSKKYVVFGNVFLDFVDTQALSTQANLVASDIYEYLSGAVLHSPMRVSLFPFRYPYGYGSGSITYLYDITGEVVSIPIMSLDLTDESVIIEVFGEDEENGKHRQDFTADERATNLSAQINALDRSKVSKSGDVISGGALFIRNSAGANDHQGRLVLNNPDITLGESHTKTVMGEVLFDDSVTSLYKATIYGNLTQANTVQLVMAARNWDSGGNALINRLTLSSLANGTVRVEVSHPNAWLDAISAATPTLVTTVSNIATAASGITINSAYFAQWGKVAQLRLRFTPSSALSGNTSVATLVSGKRPVANMWSPAQIRLQSGTTAYISDSGAIIVTGNFTAGNWYEVISTYILA